MVAEFAAETERRRASSHACSEKSWPSVGDDSDSDPTSNSESEGRDEGKEEEEVSYDTDSSFWYRLLAHLN